MNGKNSYMASYAMFWKNMANFNGRTGRSVYRQTVVINGILNLPFIVLGAFTSALFTLCIPILIFPLIAMTVRRLHDIGKSGWLALAVPFPVLGFPEMIWLFIAAGQPGENQYGKNPEEYDVPSGNAEEQTSVCSVCGTPLQPGDTVCPRCNSRIGGNLYE